MDENFNEKMVELPTEAAKAALDVLLKEKFKLKEFELAISPGSTKGDNYLGIVYRVLVKNSKPKLDKELGFIVKMPPMHPQRREQFFARPCFLREINFYDELLPVFYRFQKEKGINIEIDGFHHIPTCYQTLSEEFTEALFMQDLKLDGFQMYDRCQEMTYDHALKAFETLAKFHAVSFAIKDQCPNDPAYKKAMESEDIWLARRGEKMMTEYMSGLSKRALGTLDLKIDAKIYERVETLLSEAYLDILEQVVDGSIAEPYAIVCHGDFWTNNILYKYEDQKPIEAYLLDFQIVRYATPITDLCYFIFTCTSAEFRKKYLEDLLKVYHKVLSTLLKKLGSDPEKVFPEKVFREDFKRFGKFGLLMAIMLLPIFVAPSNETPDLEEAAVKMADGKDITQMNDDKTSEATMLAYNKRMKDVLYDSFEYGMI
uniref:CSON000421 protein n=1 Tax=Culicoides sonorensis TaxID=179676 RepID=A0A336KVV2_CULSO